MPPAARVGDTGSHPGSTITGPGVLNVLIGGQPAAVMGDLMVCPLFSGPVPHVGGPIAKGSLTVMIGGRAAARVGDMMQCAAGPPNPIAMGFPKVMIGG